MAQTPPIPFETADENGRPIRLPSTLNRTDTLIQPTNNPQIDDMVVNMSYYPPANTNAEGSSDGDERKLYIDETKSPASRDDTFYYPGSIGEDSKDAPNNLIKFEVYRLEGAKLGVEFDKIEQGLKDFTRKVIGSPTQSLTSLHPRVGTNGLEDPLATSTEADSPDRSMSQILSDTGTASLEIARKISATTNMDKEVTAVPLNVLWLYMPDEISAEYGMKYSETDMTSTRRTLDILSSVVGSDEKNSHAVKDTFKQFGVQALDAAINLIPDTVMKYMHAPGFLHTDLNSLANLRTRTTPLLNLEYLFERVERRHFDYSFKFYPKSAHEIINTGRIIQTFKYHAHPEFLENSTSRYLKVPSVFKIRYFHRDQHAKDGDGTVKTVLRENLFINKIKYCSLDRISVNYSDTGKFATLWDAAMNDPKGDTLQSFFKSPVGISLDLQFTELQLLTREDIAESKEALRDFGRSGDQAVSLKGFH